jgi:hypothetical protein
MIVSLPQRAYSPDQSDMDLSDDELQQDAEQIAKEVDPPMLMEMATWSKGRAGCSIARAWCGRIVL